MYLIDLRMGIPVTHVMFNYDGGDGNYGFIVNGTPYNVLQDSGIAAQTFNYLFPNPKITSVISEDLGYYAYMVKPDRAVTSPDTLVAWNVEGPVTKTYYVEAGVYVIYDMLGNSISYNASGGSIVIEIGPYPIYILGLGEGEPPVEPPASGPLVMVLKP
jgi:hypothetical protein